MKNYVDKDPTYYRANTFEEIRESVSGIIPRDIRLPADVVDRIASEIHSSASFAALASNAHSHMLDVQLASKRKAEVRDQEIAGLKKQIEENIGELRKMVELQLRVGSLERAYEETKKELDESEEKILILRRRIEELSTPRRA